MPLLLPGMSTPLTVRGARLSWLLSSSLERAATVLQGLSHAVGSAAKLALLHKVTQELSQAVLRHSDNNVGCSGLGASAYLNESGF